MRDNVRALWTETLRSGEIPQARGRLRTDTGMCCLGVLCELYRRTHPDQAGWSEDRGAWEFIARDDAGIAIGASVLPEAVMRWAGLQGSNPDVLPSQQARVFGGPELKLHYTSLAGLNDDGRTFQEIAEFIEKEL